MLTSGIIKELFIYDENTGFLYNKVKRNHLCEKEILSGTKRKGGRVFIRLDGISYPRSHLIWLLNYDYFPEKKIDHINGNPNDDRISNLREVTQRENCLNKKEHRDGKLPGVCRFKRDNKFESFIKVKTFETKKYIRIYLGRFNTREEAHEAYMMALPYFI